MATVYFDSSVFLAVIARQPQAAQVKDLLTELKAAKVRIYTSILTIQEVSVSVFTHGGGFVDYHTKINRLARIKGVTRDIAMTAAKFEAQIIEAAVKGKSKTQAEQIKDNRRRKFDCFHLATAVTLGCQTFYAFDDKFAARCSQLGITMPVEEPSPKKPKLPFMGSASAASPTP